MCYLSKYYSTINENDDILNLGSTCMNIICDELKYFFTVLKKIWIFIIIPIFLSIFLYIIFTINFSNIEYAYKFMPFRDTSYDIIEIILNIYWPIFYLVFPLYYIYIRSGKKIYKVSLLCITILFIVTAVRFNIEKNKKLVFRSY